MATNGKIPQKLLQDGAVGTAEIIDANITLAKLASGAVDENKITTGTFGNGLSGGGGTPAAVTPDTTGGANIAKVVSVNANGVGVKIDDDTVKENGSNQLYVDKLLANRTQVSSYTPTASQNYDDVDAEIDTAAAANNTPQTDWTTGGGVFVDASGAYGTPPTLPAPTQVTEFGRPGTVVVRDATSKDALDDGNGNNVYGVLYYNTDDSKFYIRFFSDVSDVQTAYAMPASPSALDFQFAEIDTFANLPNEALMGMPAVFVDIVAGDITSVVAGSGLSGGATSGPATLNIGDANKGVQVNGADVQVDASEVAGDGLEQTSGAGNEHLLKVKPDSVATDESAALGVSANGVKIDGDKVDVDYTPTNYAPNAGIAEADDVDDLSAHLDGINTKLGSLGGTPRQETISTQAISGTDTAMTDQLDYTPTSAASVKLFYFGVLLEQGSGKDYTISGKIITWLASSGTAPDQAVSEPLVAVYESSD